MDQILQSSTKSQDQHLPDQWSLFTTPSSSSYFSILGNPIVLEPSTHLACLVLSQISTEPVIQKLKCQFDMWKPVWFQLLKPAELKGGKQHDSNQACWYQHYAAIQEISIFWNYLLTHIYYSLLFFNQVLWVLLLQAVSHIVTDSEGRTCDELYYHQGSFHINIQTHGLNMWRCSGHTGIFSA